MPGRKNTWASPPAATPAETFRTARETPALDSSSPNDSYFPQVAAEAADNGRPSSTSRDDNRSSEELLSQDLDAVSHADKLLAQHVGPIVESPGNPYFTTVPPPPTSSFGTVLPNGPPTAPATTSPNRSSFSRTGQGHNPTLPPGQAPNWREIKGNIRRIVKFNRSGAQVACTILLVSLLSLIKPLEERFPSNTVYVVIAAIVVAEPNQTASLRLLMQRLIGVLIAGVVSLAILGLDAIVWPQNCLNCSYKPYVVGGLLFVFIYIVVSVRESVPGQAYSSKLMDLTFVVLLLGAYNDLLKSPDSPRYAPPLARMASVVVGVALTTAGAFIFWPQRLTVVHRVVTAKLFKDMASYFHDLVENGYTSLPSHPNDAFNQSIYRLEPGWTATTRTIAVEGGMEVLGSQEAVTAQGEHRSKKKSPKSRPGVGGLFGRQPPVPVPVPDIETGSIQQPSEVNCGSSVASEPAFADWGRIMTDTTIPELEDHPDLARKFHEKTHPAAVHIIRTLEKERARLEASYKVEVRWTQTPHFVPIGPLDQVIRRLRYSSIASCF
ncbi:hypothetical protein DFS34DRAFT_495419 [Phlyctochytrium arcticum]|nr:hypothetical protein DFS34DRAFT_495419 [Phlyctochytrium arcticum]